VTPVDGETTNPPSWRAYMGFLTVGFVSLDLFTYKKSLVETSVAKVLFKEIAISE